MSETLLNRAYGVKAPEAERGAAQKVLEYVAYEADDAGLALVNVYQAAKRTGLGPGQVDAALFLLGQHNLITYRAGGDTVRVQIQVDRL